MQYSAFESQYDTRGSGTREKMRSFYSDEEAPFPYDIRNWLAHIGSQPLDKYHICQPGKTRGTRAYRASGKRSLTGKDHGFWGCLMGIMTNQNACRGKLILVLVALVVLAGVRPSIAEDDDQAGWRQSDSDLSGVSSDERMSIESACRTEKVFGGPAAYNRCVASQLNSLKDARRTPDLIRQVRPRYPPLARQARIQGTVILEAIISKQGSVENLRVVKGHPLLIQRALEAVKQWRYKPTVLNGVPVEAITRITVNFNSGLSSDEQMSIAENQDPEELRKAAVEGDADAQFGLGVMYQHGLGVSKDYVEAYAWYILAAAQGEEMAVEAKDRLKSEMTAAQLTAAQDLAAELREHIESSKKEHFLVSGAGDEVGMNRKVSLRAGDQKMVWTEPQARPWLWALHGRPRICWAVRPAHEGGIGGY